MCRLWRMAAHCGGVVGSQLLFAHVPRKRVVRATAAAFPSMKRTTSLSSDTGMTGVKAVAEFL